MFLETAEVIIINRDIYGSHDIYKPNDMIEVEYREIPEAMLPKKTKGRVDSIKEQVLYLDDSDRYKQRIIEIPVNGIVNIRRIKK